MEGAEISHVVTQAFIAVHSGKDGGPLPHYFVAQLHFGHAQKKSVHYFLSCNHFPQI